MKAGLVVEGHAEVDSLPLIWREICPEVRLATRPYRLPKSKGLLLPKWSLRSSEWEKLLNYFRKMGAVGIIVLMDADDVCPIEVAPKVRKELEDLAMPYGLHIGFCLAEPEYEAWFLAGADKLGIAPEWYQNPPRGSKELLQKILGKYSPAVDQPKLTSKLVEHIPEVRKRSPSLDKLVREIEKMCRTCFGNGVKR